MQRLAMTKARIAMAILAGRMRRLVSSAGKGLPGTMHRLARLASSAGRILAAMLVGLLLVGFGWRVIIDFRTGIIRVKPFEVAKSLAEAGYTGAALAERFREKLNDIEIRVVAWRARGGREQATNRIRGEDPLGEVKVPGTDFSIEGFSDLFLRAVGRPPIQVVGRIFSTPAATVATIKASDYPLQSSQLTTPRGCDDGCVDSLVTSMAETFYSERKPCSLELYYYIRRSECGSTLAEQVAPAAGAPVERGELQEVSARSLRCTQLDTVFGDAARSCAKTDPVFAYDIWGIFELLRRNYHAAADHLQRALILADREGNRRPKLAALIYSNWGIVLTQARDCPGAVRKLDTAIRFDAKAPWAYNNRGAALAGMQDKTGAATMYDKAIDVADRASPPPALILSYVKRAHLLYDEGKFDEAARRLQRASEEVSGNTTILRHLAYSLRHAGKNDEALAAYERIIDLEPQALDAYRAAADLLRSCHRLTAAHEELSRALGRATGEERATLGCELADLEQQLLAKPEPLSSQVEACDPGADSYLSHGKTWTTKQYCYDPTSCLQMVADPRQPGTVYCIARQFEDFLISGLAVTTDAGATWHFMPGFAVGEKPEARIQRIAFAATKGALVALSSKGAISQSLDHGATWQQAGRPFLPSLQPLDVAVAPGNGGTLYTLLSAKVPCPRGGFSASSCVRYRLFTSRDLGRGSLARGSWLLADPTGDKLAGELWADPFAASTLYAAVTAGANSSSFTKSSDGGTTWRHLDVGPPVVAAAFHPAARGTLYVAVAGDCRQVLKSTDAGKHWRAANGGGLPHGTNVTALAFDASTLYAGTADGEVYATVDGAVTWHEAAPGLRESAAPILSLAADAHGTIYAGLKNGGLYILSVGRP